MVWHGKGWAPLCGIAQDTPHEGDNHNDHLHSLLNQAVGARPLDKTPKNRVQKDRQEPLVHPKTESARASGRKPAHSLE